MAANSTSISQEHQALADLFSRYKAEWLEEYLFDVFTEPAYFPQLRHAKPCFLVGGRGTGKTTTLRCLSYKGQYALARSDKSAIQTWPFYGIYHRVNTNRVRAFKGPELKEGTWIRLFSHYVNLLICTYLLEFLEWYKGHFPSASALSPRAVQEIAATLQMDRPPDPSGLLKVMRLGFLEFEAYVNNVAGSTQLPSLSAPGAPIDVLVEHIRDLPEFHERMFFFLIDEYENLEDYQQRVMNTYIKHCASGYTFKIGVRELGFRQRTTLNREEQLVAPADYVRIDITEKLLPKFEEFAAKVCDSRWRIAVKESARPIGSIQELFPGLSAEEEAEKLGVRNPVQKMEQSLKKQGFSEEHTWYKERSDLEKYALGLWTRGKELALAEVVRDAMDNEISWKQRYQNYKYAALFTIRRGKSGPHKLYTGWNTLCMLSAGNIRYLLELVTESLSCHFESEMDLSQSVSPEMQTEAAVRTGRMHLRELEGLTVYGARLTKLLLALGRVFQVMAGQSEGHTPEVNQFHLKPASRSELQQNQHNLVDQLLNAAVMHLALLRYRGSKLQDRHDIRDYDYAIHPIFAPYFWFSHRRKRKMLLSPSEILALIETPSVTIEKILRRQGRPTDSELPDNLGLFEAFYAPDTQ